jgi:hypothetical protein
MVAYCFFHVYVKVQFTYKEFSDAIFEYDVLIDSTQSYKLTNEKMQLNAKLLDLYKFFPVPREKLRLEAHKRESITPKIDNGIAARVKRYHILANNPRLLTIRGWRLLYTFFVTLNMITNYLFEFIIQVLKPLNKFLSVFFAYLSWMFFLPRIITNLLLLGKHIIPCKLWMSTEEMAVPLWQRAKTTFMRRWFELCNDIPWCLNSMLACFILVGNFASVSIQLTWILFLYDILLISIRAYLEINKIKDLKNKYIKNDEPSVLEYLTKFESLELQRFFINLISTSTVFLGFTLTLPIFSGMLLLPLIGSFLLFAGTFFSHKALGHNNRQFTLIGKGTGDSKLNISSSPLMIRSV